MKELSLTEINAVSGGFALELPDIPLSYMPSEEDFFILGMTTLAVAVGVFTYCCFAKQ